MKARIKKRLSNIPHLISSKKYTILQYIDIVSLILCIQL
jgi:hypothetical protein